MVRRGRLSLFLLVLAPLLALPGFAAAPAQQAPSAPAASAHRALAESLLWMFQRTSGNVIAAAKEMPEASFEFRPTPEVRTFGQILGHVADAQRGLCGLARTGERAPSPEWETKAKTKAELIEALEVSTTECEAALRQMDDAALTRSVPFGGRSLTAGALLAFVSGHTNEHYGNLVTYLRIRGLVPPSSQH